MADGTERDQLEQRIAELEKQVARLNMIIGTPRLKDAPPRSMTINPKEPVTLPRMISASDIAFSPKPARQEPEFDLEQWVGGRGLLLVGVVALLAASGFFLKYAFDQGWVAPWLRALGAIAGGVAVAIFGERQMRRDMRTFGLALIGAGGGLIYLGIWAMAGPYAMVGRQLGIGLIALAAGLVAWRAVEHDEEVLALWALLGAYTAPLVLPTSATRPEVFLSYVGVASVGAIALGHALAWRLAFGMAVAGYFLYAPSLAFDAMSQPFGLAYLALGGIAVGRIAAERDWPEARVFGTALPWALLIVHGWRAQGETAPWVALAGAAVLLVAGWNHVRGDGRFHSPTPALDLDDHGLAFVIVPLGFAVAAVVVQPEVVLSTSEIMLVAAALLYLITGWPGRCAPFVAAGFVLLATAATVAAGSVSSLVFAWIVLVAGMVAADRYFGQQAGPAVASGLVTLTLMPLLSVVLARHSGATGTWVGFVLGCVAAAILMFPRPEAPAWFPAIRAQFWIIAGLTLFYAGTLEIAAYFGPTLAGNLAISVYWLAFAAALIATGFTLNKGAVRGAGLAVAMLAVAKVGLYDLSQLEALYRVASFFGLALLALAIAYAYSRASRQRAS